VRNIKEAIQDYLEASPEDACGASRGIFNPYVREAWRETRIK
jgi:hypothetical protein